MLVTDFISTFISMKILSLDLSSLVRIFPKLLLHCNEVCNSIAQVADTFNSEILNEVIKVFNGVVDGAIGIP